MEPPSIAPALALRIGNQTSFAAPHFLEPFQYALANDFEAFEWFPDRKPSGAGWDETDIDASLCADLSEQARRAGIRLSVHARWTANPLEAEGRGVLERDLQLAQALDAKLLNLHLYSDAGLDAYISSLLPLLRAAADTRVQISIENTVETPPSAFNELFERLHKIGSKEVGDVGMCLDIGHANLCAATRNNFLAFADRLSSSVPIIHVHLHENWGDSDTHLPLFTGPAASDRTGIVGLLRRLKARGYAGSAILEQWPEPLSLLKDARDQLRQMEREINGHAHDGRSQSEARSPQQGRKPKAEILPT